MTVSVVGQPMPQVSAQEKVQGRAVYAGDIKMAGMLHAKLLRSPHAHARILSIDTSAAEALPGVKAVVTGNDVPGRRWGVHHKQQNVLACGLVRFVGEEVAAVVATTEAVAQDALDLIRIEYEELPAVLDIDAALSEGAIPVHPEGNVVDEINIALRYEYLTVDAVLEGLKARSDRTSVVLTGRDAKPEICEYADLVTEMTEVKHPFKAGIKAQRGVDF